MDNRISPWGVDIPRQGITTKKEIVFMKKTNWKRWIKAAGVRAIKTMAQSFTAILGTAMVMKDVNWEMAVSAALLSGILSLASSAAGLPEA